MPKTIQFEGKSHQFPDDFTDQEIAAALASAHPTPAHTGNRTSLKGGPADMPAQGEGVDRGFWASLGDQARGAWDTLTGEKQFRPATPQNVLEDTLTPLGTIIEKTGARNYGGAAGDAAGMAAVAAALRKGAGMLPEGNFPAAAERADVMNRFGMNEQTPPPGQSAPPGLLRRITEKLAAKHPILEAGLIAKDLVTAIRDALDEPEAPAAPKPVAAPPGATTPAPGPAAVRTPAPIEKPAAAPAPVASPPQAIAPAAPAPQLVQAPAPMPEPTVSDVRAGRWEPSTGVWRLTEQDPVFKKLDPATQAQWKAAWAAGFDSPLAYAKSSGGRLPPTSEAPAPAAAEPVITAQQISQLPAGEAVRALEAQRPKRISAGAKDAQSLTDKLVEWRMTPDEVQAMNEKGWAKLAHQSGVQMPTPAVRANAIFNLKKALAGPPRTVSELVQAFKDAAPVGQPSGMNAKALAIAQQLAEEMTK